MGRSEWGAGAFLSATVREWTNGCQPRGDRGWEDYDEAIRLDPNDPDVYINRGNMLSGLDEFERAIEDYSQAIRINANYSEAYHNRGIAYHRLGLYEDSERDLAKVGEIRAKTENGTPNGDGPSE